MSSRTFGAVNSTSPSLHGDSEASGRALMGGGEHVWIRIIRLMNHYIISRWSSFSLKMPQECPQMDTCMKPILSAMSRQKAFSPRVSWDLCQQMHLQKSTPTTVSFLCQRSMASHNIQVSMHIMQWWCRQRLKSSFLPRLRVEYKGIYRCPLLPWGCRCNGHLRSSFLISVFVPHQPISYEPQALLHEILLLLSAVGVPYFNFALIVFDCEIFGHHQVIFSGETARDSWVSDVSARWRRSSHRARLSRTCAFSQRCLPDFSFWTSNVFQTTLKASTSFWRVSEALVLARNQTGRAIETVRWWLRDSITGSSSLTKLYNRNTACLCLHWMSPRNSWSVICYIPARQIQDFLRTAFITRRCCDRCFRCFPFHLFRFHHCFLSLSVPLNFHTFFHFLSLSFLSSYLRGPSKLPSSSDVLQKRPFASARRLQNLQAGGPPAWRSPTCAYIYIVDYVCT